MSLRQPLTFFGMHGLGCSYLHGYANSLMQPFAAVNFSCLLSREIKRRKVTTVRNTASAAAPLQAAAVAPVPAHATSAEGPATPAASVTTADNGGCAAASLSAAAGFTAAEAANGGSCGPPGGLFAGLAAKVAAMQRAAGRTEPPQCKQQRKRRHSEGNDGPAVPLPDGATVCAAPQADFCTASSVSYFASGRGLIAASRCKFCSVLWQQRSTHLRDSPSRATTIGQATCVPPQELNPLRPPSRDPRLTSVATTTADPAEQPTKRGADASPLRRSAVVARSSMALFPSQRRQSPARAASLQGCQATAPASNPKGRRSAVAQLQVDTRSHLFHLGLAFAKQGAEWVIGIRRPLSL